MTARDPNTNPDLDQQDEEVDLSSTNHRGLYGRDSLCTTHTTQVSERPAG